MLVVVVVALSPAGTLGLAPVTAGFILLTLSIGAILPNAAALSMQATRGHSGSGPRCSARRSSAWRPSSRR